MLPIQSSLPSLISPLSGPIPSTSPPTYVTIVPAGTHEPNLIVLWVSILFPGLCYPLILINDIESIVGGGDNVANNHHL